MLDRLQTYVALATARRETRRGLRASARRILVVCYGNIYRSAFLGAYLARRSEPRLDVRSTGFHPVAGRPCPDRLVAMAARQGVDLAGHRSSLYAPEDARWADLIVVMDRHNWHRLRQGRVPRTKIVWAGAFTEGPVEILDPYESSDAELERAIARLTEAGNRLAAALADAAERRGDRQAAA